MSVKGDTYRFPNEIEKQTFAQACRDEGVDPKDRCPLCRGRRLTRTAQFRYCDDHFDWNEDRVQVDCHRCQVRYRVRTEMKCCQDAA